MLLAEDTFVNFLIEIVDAGIIIRSHATTDET